MRLRCRLVSTVLLLGLSIAALVAQAPGAATNVHVNAHLASGANLLHSSDFTYLGAFRLPSNCFGSITGSPDCTPSSGDSFQFANGWVGGVVYNDPTNGKSLFMTGDLAQVQVSNVASMAQVVIPALKDPNSVGLNNLNTATTVQGFADASGGKSAAIISSTNAQGHGNSVVFGGKLIGVEMTQYDANCDQTKFAWVGNITFGSQTGGYATSAIPVAQRFLGAYITAIPSAYQSSLGGTLIAGSIGASIASCGPIGPSLFAVDGTTLATQPATSTAIQTYPLVYYDNTHANLGAWNSDDPTQNCTTVGGTWPSNGGSCTRVGVVPSLSFTNPHSCAHLCGGSVTIPFEDAAGPVTHTAGVLFADSTRSVLVFGRKGLGTYQYGCGTSTFPASGTCAPTAECPGNGTSSDPQIYDPDEACVKGDHAFPYTEFVWAFDVNDLIAVKNGTKNPYDVVPYTGWPMSVFGDADGGTGAGIAWDASTRTMYFAIEGGDGNNPLVHAFHVGIP